MSAKTTCRNEELGLLEHLDPDLAEVPVEVIPNNSDRFVGFGLIVGNKEQSNGNNTQ